MAPAKGRGQFFARRPWLKTADTLGCAIQPALICAPTISSINRSSIYGSGQSHAYPCCVARIFAADVAFGSFSSLLRCPRFDHHRGAPLTRRVGGGDGAGRG